MGAKCDRCGNFDEGYREEMEYPKDGQHCIQDYQPDCYYYWDSPLEEDYDWSCLLYTSPSPRDLSTSRMPSSA